MFSHLLVPLDGTPMAEAVLPTVAKLAAQAHARVTLLHLVEAAAPETVHGGRHLTTAAAAEAYLKEVLDRSFAGLPNTAWHVHDPEVSDVPRGLMTHAEELGADVIVLCTHGSDRWRRWFQGNIPQRAVGRGTVPVLWLRPAAAGVSCFPFRQIVVPLDGNPAHEVSLEWASALLRLAPAKLALLRVVPTWGALRGTQAVAGDYLPGTMQALLDVGEDQAKDYLQHHLWTLQSQKLLATASVLRGAPVDGIAEFARQVMADLVVLGTHGKHGSQAFWEGSMAPRLMGELTTSFLLVPTR